MPPNRNKGSRATAGRKSEPSREILFEFIPLGNSVKVCAIDAQTGIEVAMVGPAKANMEDLKRTAAAKLLYVMSKKLKELQEAGGSESKGKLIV